MHRAFFLLIVLILATPATHAKEAIKIGSLKAANVGAAFIAKEKGYFAAEGLDVEFTYFESAQPVAVGVAAGSLDFGCTSTSAGMYALAGQGVLKIISGMYSEAPGFHNFGIMASLKASAAGLKTYKDLPGHSVAISQVGSPVHYSLALIAEKFHLDLKSMRIEPLQGVPQIVSAIEGNQVDSSVTTATAMNPMLLQHKAELVGWIGDETPWQAAVTLTTSKRIAEKPQSVEAFLRAFKRGAREYHDAFTGPGETRRDGPNAAEVLAILAKYTGQPPQADQAQRRLCRRRCARRCEGHLSPDCVVQGPEDAQGRCRSRQGDGYALPGLAARAVRLQRRSARTIDQTARRRKNGRLVTGEKKIMELRVEKIRGALSAALVAALAWANSAGAAEHIKIGALKSTNVGATYIAIEKGFFAKEGLEPELVTTETAQTTAVAAAASSIDFGTTSTSAGLFQLAGSGELRIISGFYDEASGFHNFATAVSLKAYDSGLKSYKDLTGHSVAVTQVGSPVHYSLALIAEKYHLDLNTIRILPLQSIPNMASAIKGNTADATIINSTSINPLLEAGSAKLLGWVGDETPWQTAVAFTQPKMIAQHKATVEAFLRGLKAGARFYHDAFTGSDEKPKDGPTAPEATAIIAKYTGLTPEQVKASLAHVDAQERVDVKDIIHQVEWFQSQKMVKEDVKPVAVMDSSLIVPIPGR